jgi:hypothetical protein
MQVDRSAGIGAFVFTVACCLRAAHAVDGALEINQTCATTTGCFAGDAAGFPVTIGESGSYRLTSNLRTAFSGTSAANTDMIQIDTDDVSLDLNGFTISCRRNTIPLSTCAAGSGVGVGIRLDGQNIRIAGGTVRGLAASGVIAEVGATYVLEEIRSLGNGEYGLDALSTSHGQVLRSAFRDNESSGMRFQTGGAALVLDTVTRGNATGLTVTVQGPVPVVGIGHSILSDGRSGQVARALSCYIEGTTTVCPP